MNYKITCSFLSGLAVFTQSLSIADPIERPPRELLVIDNGHVRVGIDKAMGASITELSWKSNQFKNVINYHDPGRLIQQSYYAGKKIERVKEGQHKAWSPWTWNPIQGGGVGSWARVTTFKKSNNPPSLLSVTIPKLWDMKNEEAAAVMNQKTAFEPRMNNVVVVKNQLVSKRKNNDRWGTALPRHQELPACYFTSNFSKILSYEGNGKWKELKQPPGPPWGKTKDPKQAMAAMNEEGQVIAIFSPSATLFNYGPHRKEKSEKPTHGSCVHIAPIATVKLGPKSKLTYRYWLIVGSIEEVNKSLQKLVSKYRDERFMLN